MDHTAKVWVVNIERLRMTQMLWVNFAHKDSNKEGIQTFVTGSGEHSTQQSRGMLNVWCKTQWVKDLRRDKHRRRAHWLPCGPQFPLCAQPHHQTPKSFSSSGPRSHKTHAYSLCKAAATPSCQLSTDLSPDPLSHFSRVHSLQVSACLLPHFSGSSTLRLSSGLLWEPHLPFGAHSCGRSDFCRKLSAPQVLQWMALNEPWLRENEKPLHTCSSLHRKLVTKAFPLWTYFICKRWHIQMHLGFLLIWCGKTADRKQWSKRKNFIFLDPYKQDCHAMQGHIEKHQEESEVQRHGKWTWPKDFTWVFMAKNREGSG